jgi:hypothetical protein
LQNKETCVNKGVASAAKLSYLLPSIGCVSVAVVEPVSVVDAAVGSAHAGLDVLLAADLSREADDAIVAGLREVERLRARLAAADHVLIAQAQQRGLGYTRATRDTAGLLVQLLRIGAREAHARVRAAEVCGPRVNLQGAPLPPQDPAVAAAQAAGEISEQAARIITSTVRALPVDVDTDYATTVHDTLLGLARKVGPDVVGKAARHALLLADQDGREPDADERRAARRGLHLSTRPDGTASLRGELSAECSELLQTLFDKHAAPRPASTATADTGGPATAGGPAKDPRSAAQRRHDALRDGLKKLIRDQDADDRGGVACTVLLTMDADAWRTGRGHASTGHGALIPAGQAIGWAGGDARVMAVVLDRLRAVTHYSSTRRIFTRSQRLAMTARDRGCTFPGCAAPPGWCEAHHVTDYAETGTTSIDDGTLVCGYDHRERINQGWTTTMINGRPYWIPPRWLDPDQRPIRNTLHDLE